MHAHTCNGSVIPKCQGTVQSLLMVGGMGKGQQPVGNEKSYCKNEHVCPSIRSNSSLDSGLQILNTEILSTHYCFPNFQYFFIFGMTCILKTGKICQTTFTIKKNSGRPIWPDYWWSSCNGRNYLRVVFSHFLHGTAQCDSWASCVHKLKHMLRLKIWKTVHQV